MNWRTVAASAVGTSHIALGDPCQDSCLASVEQMSDGQPLLSIFVSDGAGSASYGGDGAELAIEASAAFVSSRCTSPHFTLNDEFAAECVMAVRERLYAEAEKHGRRVRDYACTFLGVLSSSQGTLIMQIGDGGVVVDVGVGLQVPVVPMSGEYANMTHFVTDDDAIDLLASRVFPDKARKVAVFTDGIQRLALNMGTNTAHEPFFAPFFLVLANTPADQEDRLQPALSQYLNSEAINQRTDDDKTLALAVLME